ncbi:uncharacterized protein LOC133813856 [Humulus lupulus]|uniref:uncharacterized protein LOC133813856 n=1 Tax=Humulus lupulus TaxID=3486 RepID=UPI002B403EB2|nr:uncharacterized protein LOC133813856 [Humulus lupulus]
MLDQCNRTLKLMKPLHDSHSTKKFQEASSSLFEILTQQEVFWKQRSKQLWLREGDLNSKYFHASARTRRRANHIESLRNDTGEMVDWKSDLEHLMVEYFQTLFKSSVDEWDEVVSCVVPTITPSQNAMLLAPIEDDEVKSALFHMHPDKSPGPDGMSPGFYQKFWPIVGQDVIHEMKKFWQTETFDAQLPLTNIVLVPKKKRPMSMLDLRPISLCNVLYKIMSKVLANRLKQVIDCVISEAQSAFIPGRLITDNIMISYEIMHYLKRKTTGKKGYMALKLDMSKAYDRVEWGYLKAVLSKMGFDRKLVSLFMHCVTSARYQISHAGREFGHIIPERGLRQGDPLSSYLFIIYTEGFSALLRNYERRRMFRGIQVARGAPVLSHMFFADDTYIFCKATIEDAEHILHLLSVFESASGQKINYDKSSIFFSRNTEVGLRDSICGELGIHEADDTSTYLGLLNILGPKKSVILGYLKDRIQQRIHGWEGRFLSRAGKEILLKTVAQALPNYAMSDFDCHRLSFRSLRDFNLALLGKQGWRLLLHPNSLVSRVYKARYFPRGNFLSAKLGGSPRFIWRSIVEAQQIVKQGASIRVGSGRSISILEDPWLPNVEDPYIHSSHPSLVNTNVSQLMITGQNQWDKDILQDLFIARDVDLISSIPINEEETDSWYWRFEHRGIYTVKSAYAAIQAEKTTNAASDNSGFWRRLWQLKREKRQWAVMLLWALWKSRNDLVWQQRGSEVDEVIVLEKTVLNQWISAQDRSFDLSMGLVTQTDGSEHWNPPADGMIKLNTDAALFEASQTFSFSCVARDSTGALIEAFAKNDWGAVTPEAAEALGIKEALSWVKDKRWSRVEIESDCLVAVQAIRSTTAMYSYFGRIITECRSILEELKPKFVSIKFIKRSANTVAHFLARSTSVISDRHWDTSNVPSELLLVLLQDLHFY